MPLGINSISGLISGIDTSSLVDQLIQFERRPAYLLEASKARTELSLAAYGALQASLSQLKGAVESLRRPADFRGMLATSSQSELLTASAGRGAAAGVYTLTVEQLAQSHQVVSNGFADPEASLGTGTVTLSVAGVEALTVTLTDGNDSLNALATAINQAGAGISAMVVNTGDAETPYQLILSGSTTGEDQIISVSTALTGGTDIDFGAVGAVVVDSQTGSSSVTSGGHFTGNADGAFSFTVSSGGVVGSDTIVIDWTNDQGESGQVVLDETYAGEPVEVLGSFTLSFGAGDLQAGDAWSVDATSSTIQAAQDARLSFGSGAPITITSSSNTVDDLIGGVSLNLLGADPGQPVTVKVAQDVDGLVQRFQGVVDNYNATIDFFLQQFSYDQNTENGGVLLGDRTAMRLDSSIRNDLTRAVAGLSSQFDQLAQIGIGSSIGGSLDYDGKLTIDEDVLRAAIKDDLDGVIALMGSTGSSSDEDMVFLNAGQSVTPTGSLGSYEVFVTQAATQGRYEGGSITAPTGGSPLTITSADPFLRFSVDGVTGSVLHMPEGNYSSGDELATAIQNAINADEALGGKSVGVSWADDGGGQGHLEFTSRSWGGNSSVHLEAVDGTLADTLGLSAGSPLAGQDVAGYFLVDGEVEEASGSGRILTGNQEGGDTRGLSLQVNLTTTTLAEQGEAQGEIQVWSGVTDRLFRTLDGALDSVSGVLTTKQDSLRDTIDDYEKQVKAIDARLAKRKERYLKEFQRMESLLAEMTSTSNSFASMLASLPGVSSSSSSSSNSSSG